MDNKTVKDRLVEYLGVKRMGQQTFEKLAGLSNGYISNLKRMPGEEKLVMIYAAAPDLNPVWLLTGEGEMLKGEGGAAVTMSSTGDNSHNVQGDGNHVSSAGNLEVLNKAIEEMAEQRTQMSNIIDELAAQRRLTEQVLEQNNRLLTLLERRP